MNKIDYTIGDDIVALIDHSQGIFKKGDVFVCKALTESKCKCDSPLVDIGIKEISEMCFCDDCNTDYNSFTWWLHALSFKKLVFDISELTEILEKENVNK